MSAMHACTRGRDLFSASVPHTSSCVADALQNLCMVCFPGLYNTCCALHHRYGFVKLQHFRWERPEIVPGKSTVSTVSGVPDAQCMLMQCWQVEHDCVLMNTAQQYVDQLVRSTLPTMWSHVATLIVCHKGLRYQCTSHGNVPSVPAPPPAGASTSLILMGRPPPGAPAPSPWGPTHVPTSAQALADGKVQHFAGEDDRGESVVKILAEVSGSHACSRPTRGHPSPASSS
jgi:hypothetical protein